MISIIIPVYNAENFLKRCIESVERQTFENWELILVDDGSTDFSKVICDKYAQNNQRIKVIHKQNGGVSSARNVGMNHALGEYVMFLDSDDWIEPELCQELIDGTSGSDFVIGGYKAIYKKNQIEYVVKARKNQFPEEFSNTFNQLYKNHLMNTPWAKLYKRDLIRDQKFDEDIRLGEDFLFNLNYLPKCSYISIVSTTGYNYNVTNEDSATKKFKAEDFSQILLVYNNGKSFAKKYGLFYKSDIFMEKRLCLNGINLLQLLFYSNLSRNKKEKLAMDIMSNIDFKNACRENFKLPIKYEVPRKLCIDNNIIGINLFFLIKKALSKALR